MDPSNGSWLGPSRELPDVYVGYGICGVVPLYLSAALYPIRSPSSSTRTRLPRRVSQSRGLGREFEGALRRSSYFTLRHSFCALRHEVVHSQFLAFPSFSSWDTPRSPRRSTESRSSRQSLVRPAIHRECQTNSRQPSRPTSTQATHSLAVQLCDTDTGAFRRSSHPPPLPSTFHPTIKSCRDLETTIATLKSRLSFHETSSRFAVGGSLRIIRGTPLQYSRSHILMLTS
jgi:hypothetical protein